MPAHLRRVVMFAMSVVVPAEGAAQRVTGRVYHEPGRIAVSGAVVSLFDAAGNAVTRTITDADGRYGVSWPSDGARLRVVRLGFRPAIERTLYGAPRDTSIDIALEVLPAMLPSVRVSSDATCSDLPDRRAALALWEQARAGLLATVVARDAKPARMTNLTFERRLDPRTRRARYISARYGSGSSSRPFLAARSAEALAQGGFMEQQGSDQIYFAPDADVLLEESFARTHCFGVQPGDDAHRGLTGLSFEPRAGKERDALVDVRGVLWLDPQRHTITTLEFMFTGVHPLAARAGAGGVLRFQTVENGVAFICEWSMLLPRLKPGPMPRDPPFVAELGETGGLVLDAQWPDSKFWSAGIKPVRGRVTERSTGAPLAGVVATIEGLADTVDTDSTGFFAFFPLPAGRYFIQVIDTSLRSYIAPRTVTRDVLVSEGSREAAFELPTRASAIVKVCKDQGVIAGTVAVLGHVSTTGDIPRDLEIESSWQADYSTKGGALGITRARQWVRVDDSGRFRVCGVARDRPLRLHLRMGTQPVADTIVASSGDGIVQLVTWSVRADRLVAAERGDPSSLSGAVLDANSGAPVAGAEVSLLLADLRATTDSAGRFGIKDVAPGRHFVQVRHVGYLMQRDTLSLVAGIDATRDYRLTSQATLLDTVRTVAAGTKYISPSLRGFEERRARGIGYFVTEDELRKSDNRALADVLKRIPGVDVRPGPGGREYLATSRSGGMAPGSLAGGRLPSADPSIPTSPHGCWAAVYLDGIAIYMGPPQPAPDVARMQVREFAAVEVYAGVASVPMQFSALKASDCGVLLLWTRER